MAQINRSNIPSLLRPGLVDVFVDWNVYPALWKDIFKVHRSDKAVEYDLEMQSIGLAQQKEDGSPAYNDAFNQGYETAYVHQYYATSWIYKVKASLEKFLFRNI